MDKRLAMDGFIRFWAHLPEKINPVFLKIGPMEVRYYGLMYLVGFLSVYLLILYRLKTEKLKFSKNLIDEYFLWAIPAILIGARLGYIFFYNLRYYVQNPWEILPFYFKDGFNYVGIYGMSYHGALIATIFVSLIFCYRKKIDFLSFCDLLIPAIPLGYTFGRMGNFLNGELYGRVTQAWIGMYFPLDPLGKLRHPSQLYEAFFEGIFLFIIFWSMRKKHVLSGLFLPLYLIGYGLVRFFVEFFREPDPQLGFIIGPLTMGQILCLAMILAGAAIFIVKMAGHSKYK
ncbi:MAG: prolipoprotein diacylglyceryl transferase [Candidatus Omnitrophica bacterium]|nr:prolipoprotein diacylglyceryl transferase [Candidatus Omnitrophota bacterium]